MRAADAAVHREDHEVIPRPDPSPPDRSARGSSLRSRRRAGSAREVSPPKSEAPDR